MSASRAFQLLLISVICFTASGSNLTLFTFNPEKSIVKEGETLWIRANVTIPFGDTPEDPDIDSLNTVRLINSAADNARLINGSVFELSWIKNHENGTYEGWFEFQVKGLFVGYGIFEIEIFDNLTNEKSVHVGKLKVGILRTDTFITLSNIFTYTMTVLICINTFVMGLQLDWKIIVAVMRRPIAPAIGFCCQFIIMPLLAFMWASLLIPDQPILQFGYFAIGCAPGGGNSNFWTLLLDGNLDLSVTMTFCSNMAALAMMPFWLFTLGRVFFRGLGGHIKIPFSNIVVSLILLIVPCFLGILTKHYRPKFAEQSKKVIKFSTLIVILVAIVFGTAANVYVYALITFKTLICGILLPWGGMVMAYFVAYVLRQNHANCRTIAIETGIQNAGIAIILLTFSLPRPESDLALVMPVCVLIFTPLPLLFAFVGKTIYNCVHKQKDGGKEKLSSQEAKELEVIRSAGHGIEDKEKSQQYEKQPMIR